MDRPHQKAIIDLLNISFFELYESPISRGWTSSDDPFILYQFIDLNIKMIYKHHVPGS